MNSSSERNTRGLRLIGALKLTTALMLGAAGVGIFRLWDHNLSAATERFVLRLHLDPDNRLVHTIIGQVAGIRPDQLKAIGAGTLFYGFLEALEGIGLLLKRRWAEFLTVFATVLLLPVEFYELAHKISAIRVAVLLANLAILAYLIFKLRGNHVSTQDAADRLE